VIRAVVVDIGDTLVRQQVDDVRTMSKLDLVAFDDAAPMLAELKSAGYRICILSNTSQSDEAEVDRALVDLGLAPYIDAIVTSVDVGVEKPDARMFRRALERLGCGPHEAVMVGDDLRKDVVGAAAVGMATIHLRRCAGTSETAPADGGPRPTHTVGSLLEVLPWLQGAARGR
jgi:HAD superfamily hydrolase (TIGR01662 family)